MTQSKIDDFALEEEEKTELQKEGKRMMNINIELIGYLEDWYPYDEIAEKMRMGLWGDICQNWHKTNLNNDCSCTDIDLLEVRRGKGIVALIEFKILGQPLKTLQKIAFPQIAKKLGVPFFLVETKYKEYPLKFFRVSRITENSPYENSQDMTEEEFIKFLENLGEEEG